MDRVDAIGFKGQLRKCFNCGDVKIWDYPNERPCPNPINLQKPRHRWRSIIKLNKEDEESIDRQVEKDKTLRRKVRKR